MTLAEFHDRVKREINRGSAYDARIPQWVKNAARWLERNHSFGYMYHTEIFQLDEGKSEIALPGLTKSVVRAEFMASDVAGESPPQEYWFRPNSTSLLFNGVAAQNYAIVVGSYRYTDWPTDLTQTPTLLTIADDVLLWQTMVIASAFLRDPQLTQLYTNLRMEGLKTLLDAEYEGANVGHSEVMGYGDGPI